MPFYTYTIPNGIYRDGYITKERTMKLGNILTICEDSLIITPKGIDGAMYTLSINEAERTALLDTISDESGSIFLGLRRTGNKYTYQSGGLYERHPAQADEHATFRIGWSDKEKPFSDEEPEKVLVANLQVYRKMADNPITLFIKDDDILVE